MNLKALGSSILIIVSITTFVRCQEIIDEDDSGIDILQVKKSSAIKYV